jgi:hypothetical protein
VIGRWGRPIRRVVSRRRNPKGVYYIAPVALVQNGREKRVPSVACRTFGAVAVCPVLGIVAHRTLHVRI